MTREPPPAHSRRDVWAAWLSYAAFVVYGSLLPFEHNGLSLQQAVSMFRQIPFLQLGVESRADWIANGVLYVPMGLLGARAHGRGWLAWTAACLLALAIEFTQLFFPPRTVSQNDLIAEALGALVGCLFAGRLTSWLDGIRATWGRDHLALARSALRGYALACVLYCFFPFDLLLSAAELRDKLASGQWGWWFARPDDAAPARVVLMWLAEAVLSVPLGMALAIGRRPAPRLATGLWIGALLSAVIEVGQLFIASGISQGASVVSRMAGVAAGVWLMNRWHAGSVLALRAGLNRHLRWMMLVYLVPLAYAAGWGRHPLAGWDNAQRTLTDLRFTPFYYHYYTAEAVALTSLASVVAMFAPLAVLAWSRRVAAGSAALIVALIAVVVESGKLFLFGARPDPTNVLLAAASVWVLVRLLGLLDQASLGSPSGAAATTAWRERARGRAEAAPPARGSTVQAASAMPRAATLSAISAALHPQPPSASSVPVHPPHRSPARLFDRRLLPAVPVLAAAAAWALTWPAFAPLVLAAVLLAAAAAAWLPALALVIVPAALPVFDLAPWSGRFFIDEFDLLCAACLATALARQRPRLMPLSGSGGLVLLAFECSLLISALKGLLAGQPLDLNALSHLHSPLNGLRIVKGALWAWLFIVLYRDLVAARPALARWMHVGLGLGLALTVAVILWERAAMVGLFDFNTDYRITGPFSVMNKGGAYVECFLAVASCFVFVEWATASSRRWALGALILLLASTYAVFVTYSRNGYAALAIGLLVACWGLWQQRRRDGRSPLALLGVVLLVTATATPVVLGAFAQARLAQAGQDLQVRWQHWQHALNLRDDGWATLLFGMGVGRFPEAHAWRSATEPRAGAYRLEAGDGNPFLRLGPGATVYLEQIVEVPADRELQLTINLRSAMAKPVLSVTLCRKTLLTSDECEQATVEGIEAPGRWQTQDAKLAPLPPAKGLEATVPVKLSLATPAKAPAIDVDNVSLMLAVEGIPRAELLHNGSFARGMDRWFFATDIDPPWHIHSLPVGLLFDQGWLGVLCALAVVAVTAVGGLRSVLAGHPAGTAAFAAFVAFGVSGSLNTLIDEPRFLALWLLLAWLCAFHGARVGSAVGPNTGAYAGGR